jgi:hypothetical protein
VIGKWRPLPDEVLHLDLFGYLKDQIHILVDVERPKRGLVDIELSQLDQRPYRHQLVFRSVTDSEPLPEGVEITERETFPPAICVDLRNRLTDRQDR